ncbi:helix-turn-helix domain-containing protein [Streptomyces mexicanus]|uniref:helix-turn-helix domain-containing protein n=1 Tax=Streptomyces mexicanus TaxID=178566 RepID=UPI003660819A
MPEKPTDEDPRARLDGWSNAQFSARLMPDFLTVEEAAGWLRTTKGAVMAGLQRGEIPGRKVGGEWRISTAAVLALFRGVVPEGGTS